MNRLGNFLVILVPGVDVKLFGKPLCVFIKKRLILYNGGTVYRVARPKNEHSAKGSVTARFGIRSHKASAERCPALACKF
jgi:hypothetical protein